MTGWLKDRRELRASAEARAAERTEIDLGNGRSVSVRAGALRDIYAALMPEIAEHGSVTLTFGTPRSEPERPGGNPVSARRGTSQSLSQIVSVRFAAPLVAEVRDRAKAAGISVSDWLRIAAGRQIAAEDAPCEPPADLRICGWQCAHYSMTASSWVRITSPSPSCGCTMTPIYASAA